MEWNKTEYTQEVLSSLDADELEQILRTQLQKPTCQMDEDLVRRLLRELETRGNNPAFTDDAAVEKACEKFRQDTAKAGRRKYPRFRNWLITAASVAVVMGILLFSLPGMAEAESVKDVLARWSDSIFQFFTPGEPPYEADEYVFKTDNPGLQQIYDEVVALGITDLVVPMWVPEGFELHEIKTDQTTEEDTVFACMAKQQNYIFFTITEKKMGTTFQYEKNTEDIKIIEIAGTEYYLIDNKDNSTITWIINDIECSIVTDCTEEEIHKLLNSIYLSEV